MPEPDKASEPKTEACVVTALESITLHGGTPAGVAELVQVDVNAKHNARHLAAGRLTLEADVTTAEAVPAVDASEAELLELTVAELEQLGDDQGIDLKGRRTKAQIIEALLAPPTTDPNREETP